MNGVVSMKKDKRRLSKRVAVIAAIIISFAGAAGASVLIQNFMSAEFSAAGPPCMHKVAGTDTSFDAFDFQLGTTNVDNVNLTQEQIIIEGLTGDRVVADEVYRIENNCAVPLEISIVNGVQTGDWTEKHLEVWLGDAAAPGYPEAVTGDWDVTPLVFDAVGPTNYNTGVVTVAPGTSVPVGMVVSTGSTAANTGDATWTVQAEQL